MIEGYSRFNFRLFDEAATEALSSARKMEAEAAAKLQVEMESVQKVQEAASATLTEANRKETEWNNKFEVVQQEHVVTTGTLQSTRKKESAAEEVLREAKKKISP